MRIPFLPISLAFGAGIIFQKYIFPLPLMVFLLIPGITAGLFYIRGRRLFIPLLLLSMIFLGAFHGFLDSRKVSRGLDEVFGDGASERVWIEGIVKSEPETKEWGKKKRIIFVLESVKLERYSIKKEKNPVSGLARIFLYQPSKVPRPGDYVGINGLLERPAPAMNPGEFNYRSYLARGHIHFVLTGYGKKSLYIFRKGSSFDFNRAIGSARGAISALIEKTFDQEEGGFIKALILGDRKQISPAWKSRFVKTGTSHLLAISGLNIALLAGSVYFLLILAGIPQKGAAFLAFMITLIQVLIAGGGIPVQRAGWMAGAAFLGVMLERPVSLLNGFFLSLFLLLILDARSLEDISFQLSYLSLFCLIVSPVIKNKYWSWTNFALTSTVVLIGTAPVVLFHFNAVSLVSILGNLFAIPMFHLALLSGFAALLVSKIPWLGPFAAEAAQLFLNAGLNWIKFCSKSGWGYFFFPKPDLLEMIFYYSGLLLLFLPFRSGAGWKRSTALLCLAFSLGNFAIRNAEKREFGLTVLSAGKSGIAHLQLGRGRHWLIQSGRGISASQAQWTLGPYLQSRAIRDLSGVVFMESRVKNLDGIEFLKSIFTFEYFLRPSWGKLETMQAETKSLGTGDRISANPGASMEVLAMVQGDFLLRIHYLNWEILLIPEADAGIFEALEKITSAPWADAVIFSPRAVLDLEAWQKMLEVMDPKVIVGSGVRVEIQEEARKSDIRIFDVKTSGAVMLMPAGEILEIWSFLGENFKIVKPV